MRSVGTLARLAGVLVLASSVSARASVNIQRGTPRVNLQTRPAVGLPPAALRLQMRPEVSQLPPPAVHGEMPQQFVRGFQSAIAGGVFQRGVSDASVLAVGRIAALQAAGPIRQAGEQTLFRLFREHPLPTALIGGGVAALAAGVFVAVSVRDHRAINASKTWQVSGMRVQVLGGYDVASARWNAGVRVDFTELAERLARGERLRFGR